MKRLQRNRLRRSRRDSHFFQMLATSSAYQLNRLAARYAVVGIVAPHHRIQMGMLVADGPMPVSLAPVGDRSQCAGVAVLYRYLPHRVPACPGLAPYVAKAKKGERGPCASRFRMRAICSLGASGSLLCRNSGADPNTSARKPTERKRLASALRREGSSSMTSTTGCNSGASFVTPAARS